MLGTKDYLFLRYVWESEWAREISNPIWRVVNVKIYGAWNCNKIRKHSSESSVGWNENLVFVSLGVSFNLRCVPRVKLPPIWKVAVKKLRIPTDGVRVESSLSLGSFIGIRIDGQMIFFMYINNEV